MCSLFTRIFFLFLLTLPVAGPLAAQTEGSFTSLPEALAHPEQVIYLELHNQNLSDLPPELEGLRNLETLDISFNSFFEIPRVVFRLNSLKRLIIRGQSHFNIDFYAYDTTGWISHIPADIWKLQKLEYLDLSENRIQSLPPELAELPALKTLTLSHNSLHIDSLAIFARMPRLESLDLSANDLEELPREFSGLTGLREFTVVNRNAEGAFVGTQLKKFPAVLCTLRNLESLSLDGHSFKKIPKGIGNLYKLTYLSLYGNAFLVLPDEITRLSELEYLNIDLLCLASEAPLCEKEFRFPSGFCRLEKLKTLDYSSRLVSDKEKKRIHDCLGPLNAWP